ncbi:MAG: hypothetical protein K0R29_2127 [Pseudobdellovibrio sp.]|nr:hypothetical protein [Pseudobdellovibrio sp.]
MKQVINSIRWFAATLSLWTMVASPLALGAESKRVKASQIQQAIEVLGLNKKQTLGQFYEKNKGMMPERVRKMFSVYVKENANQPMPQFEVVSVKNSLGEYIPTIRASHGNELFNLQWFGETNKFIKFQNTVLREVDVVNFSDMFERVMTVEPRLRKQSEPKVVGRMIAPGPFKYPTPTARGWKKMTGREKAAYIVNLRTLWQDAKEVLKYAPKNQLPSAKPKKTSDYFFEKNQLFFQLFFGQPAEAAMANSCVVAGYVSVYRNVNGRQLCSASEAKNRYRNDELYRLAASKCQPNTIVCNPYVYGAPGGNPICVGTTDISQNGQIFNATTFDGQCDRSSRLQSADTEFSILKSPLDRSKARYSPDNMAHTEAEISKHFEDDQKANRRLVDDYLLGMLKLRGKTTASRIEDVHLNSENLALVREIKTQFESEITKAKNSCNSVDAAQTNGRNVQVEPQYWAACDQLHRRFLFIDDAVKRNCEAHGQTYNPQTLCCDCGTPDTPIGNNPPGPTPNPNPDPGTSPSPSPGSGPIASPTPTPTIDGPTPTPSPGSGPTPSPSPVVGPTPIVTPTPDPGSSPSPSPGSGPIVGPSPSPGTGPGPIAGPTPTPGGPISGPTPGTGPIVTPTPSPGSGPIVGPSPSPGTGPGPIAGPTPTPGGPISGPTPGTGPIVTPTPSPGSGPTPSPGSGPIVGPSPSPGTGPGPIAGPTPSPGSGPIVGPTPSPSPGSGPSPSPGTGPGPIAGPTPSPGSGPTPYPGVTPSPGAGPSPGPIVRPNPLPAPIGSPNPGTISSPAPFPTPLPIGGPTPGPIAGPSPSPSPGHNHNNPDPNCPYEEQPGRTANGNTPVCNGSGADFPCRCSDGQLASNIVASNGQSSADCSRVDAGTDRGGRNRNNCGVFCYIGKALPYVAVLGGAYLIWRFLAPKKPALADAPDRCPPGSVNVVPPCTSGVSCPVGSNQIPVNGVCQCPQSCEALGLVTGPACRCVQGTNPNPQTPNFTCPDGSKAINYDACPRYACWDCNSYRDPARECPPRPANPPSCTGTSATSSGTSK